MITLEEYEALRKKLEQDKHDRAKAKGALEELKKQLKAKYGVSTAEEANKLAAKERKKAEAAEKEYRRLLKKVKQMRKSNGL